MSNVVPFYPQEAAAILERLIVQGDLSRLTHQDRAEYYLRVCQSVGLNPLTQPFDYIKLNGKLKLYALKGCTDQLRALHKISVREISRTIRGTMFIVTAIVATPDGRTDQDIGCVDVGGLAGDALANAMMKAATKAKRRATLAICGLGLLDESEVETIPGAEREPPRMIAEPPKRKLQKPQTIDNRYEARIRADLKIRSAFPRHCEAEMADRDAANWPKMGPEPPPITEIPER